MTKISFEDYDKVILTKKDSYAATTDEYLIVGSNKVRLCLNSKQIATSGFFFNLMCSLMNMGYVSLKVEGCNPHTYEQFKRALRRYEVWRGTYEN